jgi:hypothetical protein
MSRTWTVRVLLTMVYRTRYSPRRAAQELGESIDATPHTRHQVTTALKFGLTEHQFDFRPGDVLVIDEAAMSGIHTLHEVVRYALRRGADVRLVGDDKQLGAVEAGGAIRLIAHDVGAVRFRKVVRFTDPNQAAASLHIREGNPAAWATTWTTTGWPADRGKPCATPRSAPGEPTSMPGGKPC